MRHYSSNLQGHLPFLLIGLFIKSLCVLLCHGTLGFQRADTMVSSFVGLALVQGVIRKMLAEVN